MRNLRIGYIYLIRNLKNGKGYVGFSLNVECRWAGHIYAAFTGKSKYPIHRALRKYGVQNFEFKVIHCCTEVLLPAVERHFIKELNTYVGNNAGYNQTLGGDGVLGLKFSEASKSKLSKSIKAYFKAHPEAREAMRKVQTGRKLTAEHKAKIGRASALQVVTPERRRNTKLAALRRWRKPAYSAKQAAARARMAVDPTVTAARSAGAKRRYADPNERQLTAARTKRNWQKRGVKKKLGAAISAGMQRIINTPEYRAKMSAIAQARVAAQYERRLASV